MATLTRKVRLHAAQSEFRNSPARYRAFCGGRGAGKSWVGAYDLLRRLRPGGSYLVASPTGVLMQDTTFPTLRALAEDFGVWGGVKLTPYPTVTVLLDGGTASIRLRTAEDPEKLRGPNLRGAWLDEASLMHEDAYKIAIGALRDGMHVGWLSATFTPKGPSHWTYQVFATGRPDTAIVRSRTDANPFLSAEFAASLSTQYGDTQFARQELFGEFVQMEGAEFPAEWFDWPGFWLDEFPEHYAGRSVYLDPSKGSGDHPGSARKKGDFQAIVRCQLCAVEGRNTFVLDAEANREPVTAMVGRAIRTVRDWPDVTRCAFEDNGTMGFIDPEFARQMHDAGLVQPWEAVTNTAPKLQRIRRVGAYLSRKQVRILNTPGGRLLRAQLGDVPLGEYDDLADAAAGAIALLGG